MHNCGDCIFVCLLSESEKRNRCPSEMAAAQMGEINNLVELIGNYETEYCENRKYPLYTGEAGWICMECEKVYRLYERKIKTGFILCVNVNIKMIQKWKIKMYIFQDLFLSLCFHKGSFFF